MDVAIGHYITFQDKCNNVIPGRAFQNFFVGETRSWEGVSYAFAPFGVSGNASSRNGDGASATLVTVPNALTVGIAVEAAILRWLVKIRTVNITCTEGAAFQEACTLAIETWNINNYTQDDEKITLAMSSPLDATRLQVPKRVLSQYLVGAVPATGAISAN